MIGLPTMVASLLNFLNNLVHIELVSIFVDCIFWLVIFLVGFPIAAVVAFLRMTYQVVYFFIGPSHIKPREKEELAVFISGCDSGFGKLLVAPLTERGYTVFCGCLDPKSFQQYKSNPLAIPVQLDVTSDKSVAEACKKVSTWLTAKSKNKRHFHALVNNAGIARLGPIDWVTMEDFQACMDVNFYGVVRVTKEFIPIFKKQFFNDSYSDARIVTVTSMAGLFLGGDHVMTPYSASKFAADSFLVNLRTEMEPYDVQVSCLNPTFHKTPMTSLNHTVVDRVWNNLSAKEQEEYGEDFKENFLEVVDALKFILWSSKNVVKAMEECVIAKYAPLRLLVGLDAKYVFPPANLLSAGIGFAMIQEYPAAMKG